MGHDRQGIWHLEAILPQPLQHGKTTSRAANVETHGDIPCLHHDAHEAAALRNKESALVRLSSLCKAWQPPLTYCRVMGVSQCLTWL